jgi:Predicted hydrolases of HD superfamily
MKEQSSDKAGESSFFAIISRMKYIDRWALMRNTHSESLSEHSLDTAIIAHALAVIRNKRFGGKVNPERAALLALFHDVPEVITGDMPTPVKYFSDEIRTAYADVESAAESRLISLLPEDMRDEYGSLITHEGEDAQLLRIVKCADKLSALIKCIEEEKACNREFSAAKASTIKAIEELGLPEGIEFLEKFIPPFALTLDDQNM